MHQHFRDRLLERWGRAVTSHPGWTLTVCCLAAVASLAVAVATIEINPDRNALMSQDLAWAKRYAAYRADFPRWSDVVICLEGEADDVAINALARDLATHVAASPTVTAADAGFPASEAGPRLWRTGTRQEFDTTLRDLERGRDLTAAGSAAAALVTMLQFEGSQEDVDPAALSASLEPWIDAVAGRPVHFDLLNEPADRWQPLAAGGGRIRLILVSLAASEDGAIDGPAAPLAELRRDVRDWLASRDAADIPWGVTGIPAIEADETTQATQDSTIASLVAFGLVTLMLITSFRRIRLPLMAAGSLVIGIAWSFGWVAVSIGHLQLLSMVFSAILIGLGIDFALHLVTRLQAIEDAHDQLPDAMSRVFRDVGPGLLTGALTTAAAFGCTAFSAFLGVAEMGVIAAGGVILCLIAIMSAFPAMLACSKRWRADVGVMRPVGVNALRRLVRPLHRRAGTVLLIGGIVTALAIVASTRLRYDSNIMNLQPAGLEAVTWQRRLAEAPGADLWSGLVLTDADDAARLTQALRTVADVQEVTGMGVLFPPDLAARQAAVARVREAGASPATAPDNAGFVPTVLSTLRDRLRAASTEEPGFAPLVSELDAAVQSWHDLDRDFAARTARIDRLNAAWAASATPAATWIDEALAAPPPGASDLPPLLRSQWIGTDGAWLLRVAPVVSERSILEPDRLGAFVQAVRTVAPDVLGPPVQIYESSRLIVRAYVTSGLLAMAVVLILLLLDFRSIADAFGAMLPVFIGFPCTFGFMALVDLNLNFANLMVLPLIFGIGVDSGVHVVHRWKSNPKVRPPGLWGGTGSGILMTTVTTAIGFGALMIAEHRGIRSLAIVMVVGLAVTLAASWTVLPALLRVRQRRLSPRSADRH
ncbi:MAG: MMPL family transporter [Phycisphaerales bacterium]|jgi:hypothetical protein|nr:MMPL family transporter [Phycisphaerales bacterium]